MHLQNLKFILKAVLLPPAWSCLSLARLPLLPLRLYMFVLLVTAACVRCGCTRLVYTSTYNVVFGGQEIRNADESIPYLPLDKVV